MIATQLSAGVATIELADCRPLSTWDLAFGRAVRDTVQALADDDRVRVIVMSSGAADFCAPVPSAAGASASAEVQAVYGSASGLYQTLCYCPKVLIAAVHGRCSGAGSAMLLCADLAVASDDVQIEAPFADIPQASYVLAALTMRMARAKAWSLGGEAMDASAAMACGMVNRVVPRAELMTQSKEMAQRAARMPLDGIRISKVMRETYLDSQGVGQEFDQAGFYAAGALQARAGGPRS